MIQFDLHIFFRWVVQPPTRLGCFRFGSCFYYSIILPCPLHWDFGKFWLDAVLMWRPEDPHRSEHVQTIEHCIRIIWVGILKCQVVVQPINYGQDTWAATIMYSFCGGIDVFQTIFYIFLLYLWNRFINYGNCKTHGGCFLFIPWPFFVDVTKPSKLHRLDAACSERFVEQKCPVPATRHGATGQRRVHEDYKYLLSAMQSHPERFLGVFVADPNVTDPETWMEDITKSHKNWVPWSCVRVIESCTLCWERRKKRGANCQSLGTRNNRFHMFPSTSQPLPQVGVRFNPYKWPEGHGMADDVGKRLLHGLKLRQWGCGMKLAATRYFHLIEFVMNLLLYKATSPPYTFKKHRHFCRDCLCLKVSQFDLVASWPHPGFLCASIGEGAWWCVEFLVQGFRRPENLDCLWVWCPLRVLANTSMTSRMVGRMGGTLLFGMKKIGEP